MKLVKQTNLAVCPLANYQKLCDFVQGISLKMLPNSGITKQGTLKHFEIRFQKFSAPKTQLSWT